MKLITFSFFILLSIPSFSQINVGSVGEEDNIRRALVKFTPGSLKALKNTNTVFVYGSRDEENLTELKEVLSKIWTFNDLKFQSYSDFIADTVENNNISYISIDMKSTQYSNSNGSTYYKTYIYLVLWMSNDDNTPYTFARIDLFPSYSSITGVQDILFHGVDGDYQNYLYEKAIYRNWNLGFLKNALQLVNNHLIEGNEKWMNEQILTNDVKELKSKTLYISESSLIKFGKFSGDESEKHEVTKLLKNYEFKYKVVSDETLSNLITEDDEVIYYVSYVKSCTDKFFAIVNSQTGEIIYSNYDNNSYNIDSGDFSRLSKSIVSKNE